MTDPSGLNGTRRFSAFNIQNVVENYEQSHTRKCKSTYLDPRREDRLYLCKRGIPSAGSPTDTLLRLSSSQKFHPRSTEVELQMPLPPIA